jgi:hypothetical protein
MPYCSAGTLASRYGTARCKCSSEVLNEGSGGVYGGTVARIVAFDNGGSSQTVRPSPSGSSPEALGLLRL